MLYKMLKLTRKNITLLSVNAAHVFQISRSVSKISSHILFKVKTNVNCDSYIKASIVPRGNLSRFECELSTDAYSCYPKGAQIV